MHPNKLQGQAFDLKDVFNIARAIFSGDDDFLLQEPLPCPDPDHAQMECSSTHDSLAPCVKTKTVQFQNDYCKEDNWELEALIYQLHALLVWDPKYMFVYARCTTHFPNVMMGIPRLGYQVNTTAAYLYQFSAPLLLLPQP